MPQNKRKGVGTGTRTPRERGAYGNSRGKPALAKTHRRENDPRVQTGLAKARAQQAALDARIAAELSAEPAGKVAARQPSVLPTSVVTKPTELRPSVKPVKYKLVSEVHPWAEGDKGWSLAEAREQVRQGYSLARVIKRTGWGQRWLRDACEDVRP